MSCQSMIMGWHTAKVLEQARYCISKLGIVVPVGFRAAFWFIIAKAGPTGGTEPLAMHTLKSGTVRGHFLPFHSSPNHLIVLFKIIVVLRYSETVCDVCKPHPPSPAEHSRL